MLLTLRIAYITIIISSLFLVTACGGSSSGSSEDQEQSRMTESPMPTPTPTSTAIPTPTPSPTPTPEAPLPCGDAWPSLQVMGLAESDSIRIRWNTEWVGGLTDTAVQNSGDSFLNYHFQHCQQQGEAFPPALFEIIDSTGYTCTITGRPLESIVVQCAAVAQTQSVDTQLKINTTTHSVFAQGLVIAPRSYPMTKNGVAIIAPVSSGSLNIHISAQIEGRVDYSINGVFDHANLSNLDSTDWSSLSINQPVYKGDQIDILLDLEGVEIEIQYLHISE